jgi:hypothetical protein
MRRLVDEDRSCRTTWPLPGDSGQGSAVIFGIQGSGHWMAMSQNLANLQQRRAGSTHCRRRAVPKPVRTHWWQPCPVASPRHDGANRGIRQGGVGCPHLQEQSSAAAMRTGLVAVIGQSLADIHRQRELVMAVPLTGNKDLATAPIHVI